MESYLLLDKERKLESQLGNFASAAEHLLGSVPLDELSLVLRVRTDRTDRILSGNPMSSSFGGSVLHFNIFR
jgi:hypothetical protein